ncbi:hypothetical protein ACIQWN_23970 [Streptomyces vinaceus]|uniref:hypothetical protein n=1 Tax=Streptomyces vinaceus TaxID=1960 RepID=UPI0037FB8471
MARPLGELQGETAEANDFARWLRKTTNGVGVRQLESDFPYSKSLWTQFRNGSRLIPRELLDQVVNRYLHEPAMRQRQLDEGHRLFEEALRSAARARTGENGAAPAARPRPGDAQALLRLDDARLRQIEAMRRLHASERRCDQLQDLVSELERRCTLLQHERDRARDEVRAELQRQVQMSAEYRRQADLKLKRARRAREEAYELRLAAEAQVARAQLDVLQRSGAEAEDIKGNETISNFKDLAGRSVSTRAYSTSQQGVLKDNAAVIVTRPDTRGCVAALRAHQVEAVIDDQVALYGYTEKFDDLEVPPAATDGQQAGFYAIALPKETPDGSCRDVFRALQQYVRGPWKLDFQSRLGSVVQAFPTTWNAFTPSEGDMNESSSCSA